MNDMKNVAIIDAASFETLVRESEAFNAFKNRLIMSLTLNYRGEDLYISSDDVINALKMTDGQAVIQRESDLRKAWEKKHKEEEE